MRRLCLAATIVCALTLRVPGAAAADLQYVVIDATGAQALERWHPVGRALLSLSDDHPHDPVASLQMRIAVSKAGQEVHGIRRTGLGLPLPQTIRFQVRPDAVHLFVVIGDRAGRRAISRVPIEVPPRWQWSTVLIPVDQMLPMGLGAPRPTDFDTLEVLTRESSSAFLEGVYRTRFEQFEAGYLPGNAPPQAAAYTRSDLDRDLAPLPGEIAGIDDRIAQGRRAGLQLRRETVTRTMLARYAAELPAMFPDLDPQDARRHAAYLRDRARHTIARLDDLLRHPKSEIRVPDVRLQNVRAREGSFFAGDRPVVLAGLCGWFAPENYDALSASGYTSVSMEVGPSVTRPAPGVAAPERMDPLLRSMDAAARHNIAVDMLLSPHYFPDWARAADPGADPTGWRQKLNGFMPWTITDPGFRGVIADHLAVAVPRLRSHPALISYDLINEAWYRLIPDFPAADFDAYRRSHPAADYWQAATDYATGVFTGFTRWYTREVERHDRTHPIHMKVFDTHEQQSIDREATGDIQTANGMDVMPSYPDRYGQLGADLAWPLLRHDFHRSLTPDKPILDGEYHISDGKFWQPPAYFKAALWDLALHGRDVCNVWVLDRVDDVSLYWHPAAVEALGLAALDFLRLGPEIHAFQRQTGDLAMLYGGSNAREAYLACAFQDRDVRIVTAARIRAGVLGRCRALVIPANCRIPADVRSTIARWAAAGGRVVRCGPGSGAEDLWPEVAAAAAACAPTRVRTGQWGIECRSIVLGQRRLLYVLNHRRAAARVALRSDWRLAGARDLLTGAAADARSLQLNPLEIRLLEVR